MNKDLETSGKRLSMNRLGLWLFFLSESFLFVGLLTARFFLQGVNHPPEVNQPLGFAISIVLLLSGLTAYRAETYIAHRMEKPFRRNIFIAIFFRTLFLIGVGIEWSEAFRFFPPSSSFGTIFFTLTGFHA